MEDVSIYKGHNIKVTTEKVTPRSASPHILRVSLFIDDKPIEAVVGSDFPPYSFVGRTEEEGVAYAKQAALRIIYKM